MTDVPRLYHLAPVGVSLATYRPASLDSEGFTHLSTWEQLETTLNAHFGDVESVRLLAFDAADLGDVVRWERVATREDRMPHWYGEWDARLVRERSTLDRVGTVWRISRATVDDQSDEGVSR
ncbi:MAG: DUF952 domain-containing protein [Planctomycetes bacterium]|nr:DUF952 domain-containing protein [Planctomycetota bacterium]